MWPQAIHLWGLHLPPGVLLYYAAVLIVFTIAAYWFWKHLAIRAALVLPVALVAGIYCARVWHLMFYTPRLDLRAAVAAAAVSNYPGRESIMGGILGGLTATVLIAVCLHVKPSGALAGVLYALPWGVAAGRVGCFLNGCCFGQPTHMPWGVVFDANSPAGFSSGPRPLHPTQLYEAAAHLVLGITLAVVSRPAHARITIGLSLVGLGLIRVAVELVRADGLRALGPITNGQMGAAGLVLAGLVSLFSVGRCSRKCVSVD